MPKRSIIAPGRKAILSKKNTMYGITCYQNEFLCRNHPNGNCERGFFSLFLQVLYGMDFAKKLSIPCYVDFSNVRYAYSPKGKGKTSNFWDYFFDQKAPKTGSKMVPNLRYETHPLRIWDRSFLREMHLVLRSELHIKPNLQKKFVAIINAFQNYRVLGAHVRKTDHAFEVPPVEEEVFFKRIGQKLKTFDKLFVATDDIHTLNSLHRAFPGKVLAHDFIRSKDNKPVHDHGGREDGLLLAEQALLDCYSLSCCQELVLSPSNLSYAALVFNPEIKYALAESAASRWSRGKTRLAYQLDRCGLRKW
jgi:hypothetical protein